MKASRNILLSLELLAAHKLRTALSVLGIVVGVASVVLMVSAGSGAEKRILDRIRGMGTDLLIVNAAPARLMIGRQRKVATVTTLTPAPVENAPGQEAHVVGVGFLIFVNARQVEHAKAADVRDDRIGEMPPEMLVE